ncbi:MAG: ABC transporter permease, partial [Lachnospiraceae bacterium]|nr:ABC transporter permease [Lachnospiraceae bacterium]
MSSVLNLAFLTSFLAAAVRMGVPFAYASLGETISQKSGLINIGLEANMLCGSFFGFAAAYATSSNL